MARYANARTAEEYREAAKDKAAPNLITFVKNYGTEGQCEEALIKLRWPEGFKCEKCGGTEYRKLGTRREYYCCSCLWQFSATSGTMLAHTKVPLTAWFLAAFLLVTGTNGVSAQRVARECEVSDKTAGNMLRRLRTAMGFAMRLCKVGGDYVEVDGAHVACGNPGGEVTRPGSGKTDAPVLVAVSGSSCVIRAVSDSTQGTMEAFASAHVSRNHEVRCDLHGANLALVGGWDVVAKQSAADGDTEASLPAIHHIISNFKAMLSATHHGVSVKRLQEYGDQFAWRYSHRTGDTFLDLLREVVRWPHVDLRRIKRCRTAMPKHPAEEEPGKRHNQYVRRRHRAEIEAMEQRIAEWKGAGRDLMDVLERASELRGAEELEARERKEREEAERRREERERAMEMPDPATSRREMLDWIRENKLWDLLDDAFEIAC